MVAGGLEVAIVGAVGGAAVASPVTVVIDGSDPRFAAPRCWSGAIRTAGPFWVFCSIKDRSKPARFGHGRADDAFFTIPFPAAVLFAMSEVS